MGWNDRLPEDPYIPPENQSDDYYAQQYSYEEWLAYVKEQSGLLKLLQKPAPQTQPRFKQINRDAPPDTPF